MFNPSMVQETRIIFDLDDLKRTRLQCSLDSCDGKVVFGLVGVRETDLIVKTPAVCPRCGEQWQVGRRAEAVDQLLRAIQTALDWVNPSAKIRFEMNIPSD